MLYGGQFGEAAPVVQPSFCSNALIRERDDDVGVGGQHAFAAHLRGEAGKVGEDVVSTTKRQCIGQQLIASGRVERVIPELQEDLGPG